jgi:predicted tellurium resistance membrane protein TerC
MAGARERKRAERRKRKRRADESGPPVEGNGASQATPQPQVEEESFQERMSRRYEERNSEARAKLEPLERGERPKAVTVGAIVSGLLAVIFTVSAVLAVAGVEAGGREIKPAPVIIFAAVLVAMTVGMWRSRYWAVLGFQTLLLLVLVASSLGLVQVQTIVQAVATLALLLGSGALFYFMIRALARIQMPGGPSDPKAP